MKERWFNFRPICLVATFLLLGSVFAFYITTNTIISSIVAVVVAVILLVIAILKKRLIYFGIPLTAFTIGVFAYNMSAINYNKSIDYIPSTIEARISAIGKPTDKYVKVTIDNCYFNSNKAECSAYVIIYDDTLQFENIEIGQKISFKPVAFNKLDLVSGSTPNSHIYEKNIKYTAITSIKGIKFNGIDKTFAEKFQEKAKDNLYLSLTEDNAELAYSSLFGDKTELNDYQISIFRLAGIAHLLAVSGLHIGIIVSTLTFLLKPLKSKKWLSFSIICLFLMFYIYLCDFSMSVIRASIMAIILLISKILNEEYDIYNSISIACIIIYLKNPLCIFDVSFLMSFLCVLGIAMLSNPISKALTKLKVNPKLVSAISISMSTTMALIMICAVYFNNFNAVSVFANVILIPLFTLAFVPIFIVTMLSIICPYIAYVLFPLNYLLDFISYIAAVFANSFLANLTTLSVNYIAIIIYFVFIVIIGRLCSAKHQYKIAISLPMVALLLYCLI